MAPAADSRHWRTPAVTDPANASVRCRLAAGTRLTRLPSSDLPASSIEARTVSSGHSAKNRRCLGSVVPEDMQQTGERMRNRLPAHRLTISFKVLCI